MHTVRVKPNELFVASGVGRRRDAILQLQSAQAPWSIKSDFKLMVWLNCRHAHSAAVFFILSLTVITLSVNTITNTAVKQNKKYIYIATCACARVNFFFLTFNAYVELMKKFAPALLTWLQCSVLLTDYSQIKRNKKTNNAPVQNLNEPVFLFKLRALYARFNRKHICTN